MDTSVPNTGPGAARQTPLTAGRLVGVAALLCTVTLVAAAYVFHAALPFNPVRLPGVRGRDIRTIAPQGWAFFTRDPQEERLLVRVPDASGNWSSEATTTSSAPRHLFGALRSARAQSLEMNSLLSKVRPEQWTACDEAPDACLSRREERIALVNSDTTPTLCGAVGFVLQRPIPWAWARRLGDVQIDSKVLLAQVSCSN